MSLVPKCPRTKISQGPKCPRTEMSLVPKCPRTKMSQGPKCPRTKMSHLLLGTEMSQVPKCRLYRNVWYRNVGTEMSLAKMSGTEIAYSRPGHTYSKWEISSDNCL